MKCERGEIGRLTVVFRLSLDLDPLPFVCLQLLTSSLAQENSYLNPTRSQENSYLWQENSYLRQEKNTIQRKNVHIHKWFRIRSKSNTLMQSYKVHQHIGKNQDNFIESNRVQEEIQPMGLQSSISFLAEWNSLFSSLQSINTQCIQPQTNINSLHSQNSSL